MNKRVDNVKDYLFHLQSRGKYSFTLKDAFDAIDNSQTAIKREVARLSENQKIKNIRQGFYIIVPPEYAVRGTMPVILFIDNLMNYLNRKYYMGLLSAGQLHGAAHQKVQISYVMTTLPTLHDIRKDNVTIIFTSIKNWPEIGITETKTDTGTIKVSSPALTALDLIKYQRKLGGLNKVSTILEEIAEEVTEEDLKNVIPIFPSLNAIQRLGYIWDKLFGYTDLAKIIHKKVENKLKEYVPLDTGSPKKGSYDPKWKIVENISIETDL